MIQYLEEVMRIKAEKEEELESDDSEVVNRNLLETKPCCVATQDKDKAESRVYASDSSDFEEGEIRETDLPATPRYGMVVSL